MTKYIHPKLWREANYFKTEYIEWYKISCDWLLVFGDNYITLGKLLNLWFEPVKEEVPEWIDEVIRYVSARDRIAVSNDWKEHLKTAILDNMPKQEQQKITIDEIDRWAYAQLNYSEKELGIRAIVNFLISQWLLQE